MKKMLFTLLLLTLTQVGYTGNSWPEDPTKKKRQEIWPGKRAHQVPHWKKRKRFKQRQFTSLRYITLGGGIAPWHNTLQPGMSSTAPAIDIFLETGKEGHPLSFALAYNAWGPYEESLFELRPAHLSFQTHYRLLQTRHLKAYGFVGISFWQAGLKLKPYPGIVNYENKTETDQGIGLVGGMGAAYTVGYGLDVGIRATAYAGQGAFLAGGFEQQPVQTGSIQASLYLAYTFSFGKPRIQCPIF